MVPHFAPLHRCAQPDSSSYHRQFTGESQKGVAESQIGYRRGVACDHLLDRPLESLDAIRNSATMKDVLGWSNQQEAAISARAK
jgi:hypothetical protein